MLPYIGASDVIPRSVHWTKCTSFHSSCSFVSKNQFSELKENVQSKVFVLFVRFLLFLICVEVSSPGSFYSIFRLFLFVLVLVFFARLLSTICQKSLIPVRCGLSVIFILVKCIPRDCNFLYFTECCFPFSLTHWCVPFQSRLESSLLMCK